MPEKSNPDLMGHMARIVAGYASKHHVDDLPALMREVYAALVAIDVGEKSAVAGGHEPAVAISKSVMPDYLICL